MFVFNFPLMARREFNEILIIQKLLQSGHIFMTLCDQNDSGKQNLSIGKEQKTKAWRKNERNDLSVLFVPILLCGLLFFPA
jgi:hypothetical protein